MPVTQERFVSRYRFSQMCGVTPPTIDYHAKKGNIALNKDGFVDLKAKNVLAFIDKYKAFGKTNAGRKPSITAKAYDHSQTSFAEQAKQTRNTTQRGIQIASRFVAPSDARDCVAMGEAYVADVLKHKLKTNKLAIAAVERHVANIKASKSKDYPYRFDRDAANRAMQRIETFPHIKGKWAAKREYLLLAPWQAFFVMSIFGWLRRDNGKRRFREVYACIPRKNAKSTLAAAIGNVMLMDDDEYGAEVYAGATSEKQAWEVFGPAKIMLEKSPAICAEKSIQIWARAIVKADDQSKFWPLIGKPGDGASPSCAIVDEYHEHPDSDLVDTMITGMGAREQPLMLIITTAGVDLASPCYDKHQEAIKVLNGQFEYEQLFTIIYGADEGDDWTKPATVIKANPNIGVSVDEEFLIAQQKQAVQNPAYQTRFKTKHLNIWCQASVAGINIEDWKACKDANMRLEQFKGDECHLALDLASKIDVCDKLILFTKGINGQKHYYAFATHYLPERTIEETHVNKNAYMKWMHEGYIVATPGAEVDFDIVGADVKADASNFMVREVIYDPWRATQLAHQLQKEGAIVVEMAQNVRNMGEAFDELLSALKAKRFHHTGDPVLEWMASNVVAKTVAKGLVIPSKDTADAKIDGIVALTMAIARAMLVPPSAGVMGWFQSAVAV